MAERILIAGSMDEIRGPLVAALQRRGYETDVALCVQEVLASLRREVPRLLLLDIDMPELNGVEALRRIRSHPRLRDLPIVVLTDVNDRQAVLEARDSGVRTYLLKSAISVDELVKRITAALPGKVDPSKPD